MLSSGVPEVYRAVEAAECCISFHFWRPFGSTPLPRIGVEERRKETLVVATEEAKSGLHLLYSSNSGALMSHRAVERRLEDLLGSGSRDADGGGGFLELSEGMVAELSALDIIDDDLSALSSKGLREEGEVDGRGIATASEVGRNVSTCTESCKPGEARGEDVVFRESAGRATFLPFLPSKLPSLLGLSCAAESDSPIFEPGSAADDGGIASQSVAQCAPPSFFSACTADVSGDSGRVIVGVHSAAAGGGTTSATAQQNSPALSSSEVTRKGGWTPPYMTETTAWGLSQGNGNRLSWSCWPKSSEEERHSKFPRPPPLLLTELDDIPAGAKTSFTPSPRGGFPGLSVEGRRLRHAGSNLDGDVFPRWDIGEVEEEFDVDAKDDGVKQGDSLLFPSLTSPCFTTVAQECEKKLKDVADPDPSLEPVVPGLSTELFSAVEEAERGRRRSTVMAVAIGEEAERHRIQGDDGGWKLYRPNNTSSLGSSAGTTTAAASTPPSPPSLWQPGELFENDERLVPLRNVVGTTLHGGVGGDGWDFSLAPSGCVAPHIGRFPPGLARSAATASSSSASDEVFGVVSMIPAVRGGLPSECESVPSHACALHSNFSLSAHAGKAATIGANASSVSSSYPGRGASAKTDISAPEEGGNDPWKGSTDVRHFPQSASKRLSFAHSGETGHFDPFSNSKQFCGGDIFEPSSAASFTTCTPMMSDAQMDTKLEGCWTSSSTSFGSRNSFAAPTDGFFSPFEIPPPNYSLPTSQPKPPGARSFG